MSIYLVVFYVLSEGGVVLREKLGVKELFIMGGALFSMHFGASCMLYPVTWGKNAGTSLPLVYIGIFLSGIMLPFLGYIALVKGKGNFLDITRRASPKFGILFVAITILVLGPIYVVPRMSAASWSAILQLTGWKTSSSVPIVVFSIIYYVITYWFVSSSGKVVDRVGKILFPVLIVIVIAIIVKSIVKPVSTMWTAPAFTENPVVYGFLQGYATGDLQCALMFGLVVVQGIRNAGISENAVNKNLIKVGIVGLGMLALTHLGHMIAGANLGGTINLTLSALYTEMVLKLFGRAGGIFFNVALVAAALTTAIGCVSSTAEIWEKLFKGNVSYKLICAVSCVLSCVVSIAGLDTIVTVVGPILDACYPAAIVLAVYYCIDKSCFQRRRLLSLRSAMVAALVLGFMNMYHVYIGIFSLNSPAYEKFYLSLPLAKYSLAWIPFSIAAFIVTWILARNVSGEAKAESVIE